jgi:hypothetical protein
MAKREKPWALYTGGNDRVHFYCTRCDTSVTVLLPVGLDEMARFARAYSACHRRCKNRLWVERARLLRVLRRRLATEWTRRARAAPG